MQTRRMTDRRSVIAVPVVLAIGWQVQATLGDEPTGRLGRLFRFGGNGAQSAPSEPKPTPPLPAAASAPPPTALFPGPITEPVSGAVDPPATAPGASPAPTARLIPQPRISRGITDADPIVTRVTIGRSAEGSQFGMFMQVFADGTVIDSEGVHQVGREGIRPLIEALESSDAYRLRGHCGGPPTDFVEQVQMVVYERSLGRLKATSFSFSGNAQGCDKAVSRLQSALEAIQLKISRPAGAPATASAPLPPVVPPAETQPSAGPGTTIRLNEDPIAPLSPPSP